MVLGNIQPVIFAIAVMRTTCLSWGSDMRLLRPRRIDNFEPVMTVPAEDLSADVVQRVVGIPAQQPCYTGACVQPIVQCSVPPCDAASSVTIATVVQDHTLENAKISHDELETQAAAIESLAAEESAARAFAEKRTEVAKHRRTMVQQAARREEVKAAGILGASAGRAQQEAANRDRAVASVAAAAAQYTAAAAARAAAQRERNATEAAIRQATADATVAVMNSSAVFTDAAVKAGEAEVKASRLRDAAAFSAEAAETAKLQAQVQAASASEATETYEKLAAEAAASEQKAALLRAQAETYTARVATALGAYRNSTAEAEQAQRAIDTARDAAAVRLDGGMRDSLIRVNHTAAVATETLAQVRASALQSEDGLMRRVRQTIEDLIPNAQRVEMPRMAVPVDPPAGFPCSACA